MLRNGDRHRIIPCVYDELRAQCGGDSVLAHDGERSRRIGGHGECHFSLEQVDLAPLWGKRYVECGVCVENELAAVLEHELLLLPDRSPMLGCLKTKLIEEGFPGEARYREKEQAGDKTPPSKARPPSTAMGTSRSPGVRRRTQRRAYMIDFCP